jgi:hypothetical protein
MNNSTPSKAPSSPDRRLRGNDHRYNLRDFPTTLEEEAELQKKKAEAAARAAAEWK